MTILLDMDGVITNFTLGACQLFNQDYSIVLKNWKPGEYDVERQFVPEIPTSEFFEKLEEAGSDFWFDLEPYDYAKELWDWCNSLADTYFCTAPILAPECMVGKIQWLRKFTGDKKFDKYIITPYKFLCADPDTILIDDSDKKVNRFQLAGGEVILVPRIWNLDYKNVGNTFEIIKNKFNKLIS